MEDKVTHSLKCTETSAYQQTDQCHPLPIQKSWNEIIMPNQVQYHLLPVGHDVFEMM